MKIYLAKYEPNRTGGGWSFMKNFHRGLGDNSTTDYDAAEVFFISGATMLQRDEVEQAKMDGKKIVLRVDNAVRNSRNRNTGMSRMKDFAAMSDLVIYQSKWAYDYLNDFLGNPKSRVILNGTNLSRYTFPTSQPWDYNDNYIYSRYNRDETKNWEVARYWFSQKFREATGSKLYIVGQFSDELRDGNFDFYNNETYKYLGVLDELSMAELYRQCKYYIYTYYNDACSNTLIEALASGCKVVGDGYYRTTGGASEIIETFRNEGRSYFSFERMTKDYLEAISELL